MKKPLVSIVMSSDSDLETFEEASAMLRQFGVPHELRVLSAHRCPEAVQEHVQQAPARGVKIFIAGAGGAAHLAGAVAAHTTLPVLGVPMDSKHLHGLDSLLATVQMPKGVAVGTLAIGAAGAANAGLLAVQILALSDEALRKQLSSFKRAQAERVIAKDHTVRGVR